MTSMVYLPLIQIISQIFSCSLTTDKLIMPEPTAASAKAAVDGNGKGLVETRLLLIRLPNHPPGRVVLIYANNSNVLLAKRLARKKPMGAWATSARAVLWPAAARPPKCRPSYKKSETINVPMKHRINTASPL